MSGLPISVVTEGYMEEKEPHPKPRSPLETVSAVFFPLGFGSNTTTTHVCVFGPMGRF